MKISPMPNFVTQHIHTWLLLCKSMLNLLFKKCILIFNLNSHFKNFYLLGIFLEKKIKNLVATLDQGVCNLKKSLPFSISQFLNLMSTVNHMSELFSLEKKKDIPSPSTTRKLQKINI